MVTQLSIIDCLRRFVTENYIFDQETFTLKDDDSFLQNGIIDSTGVVELVLFVEETFRFTVADEEIVPENFDSLDKLAKYVSTKLASAGR